MSCSDPLVAIKEKNLDSPGKYRIRIFSKFTPDKAVQLKDRYGEALLYLPCGHCPSCKMAYRKDWSIRCEMESLFHKQNCFLTLTLDNSHIKPVPVKEDIQYFLHKLRDTYGIKCRYFACGELGSRTYRSHYHMILFGYMPDDLKYWGQSNSGQDVFTSKFLNKVWNQGDVYVGYFDISCAAYVAGYVKKDKNQAFIMESTRPGLGHDYMMGHFHDLFKYGKYQGKNGQLHRLPRYFSKLAEKHGYDLIHLKIDQAESMDELNKAAKFNKGIFQDMDLFAQDGIVMKDKLKKLKRGL